LIGAFFRRKEMFVLVLNDTIEESGDFNDLMPFG